MQHDGGGHHGEREGNDVLRQGARQPPVDRVHQVVNRADAADAEDRQSVDRIQSSITEVLDQLHHQEQPRCEQGTDTITNNNRSHQISPEGGREATPAARVRTAAVRARARRKGKGEYGKARAPHDDALHTRPRFRQPGAYTRFETPQSTCQCVTAEQRHAVYAISTVVVLGGLNSRTPNLYRNAGLGICCASLSDALKRTIPTGPATGDCYGRRPCTRICY